MKVPMRAPMMHAVTFVAMCGVLSIAAWAHPQSAGQEAPKVAPGAVPAGFEGSPYAKARDIPARSVRFTATPA